MLIQRLCDSSQSIKSESKIMLTFLSSNVVNVLHAKIIYSAQGFFKGKNLKILSNFILMKISRNVKGKIIKDI